MSDKREDEGTDDKSEKAEEETSVDITKTTPIEEAETTTTDKVTKEKENVEVETEEQEAEHESAAVTGNSDKASQDDAGSSMVKELPNGANQIAKNVTIRPSLPRNSKDNHKFLADTPTTQKNVDVRFLLEYKRFQPIKQTISGVKLDT